MAITLQPIQRELVQNNLLRQQRFARVSDASSPYEADILDAKLDGYTVTIRPVGSFAARHDRLPAPSFSAQLLALGLHHNVEGLIQKAHEQLGYTGITEKSAQHKATQHYEQAQDNFARDSLHVVERNF